MKAMLVWSVLLAACAPDLAYPGGHCGPELACVPEAYCYRGFCLVDQDAGAGNADGDARSSDAEDDADAAVARDAAHEAANPDSDDVPEAPNAPISPDASQPADAGAPSTPDASHAATPPAATPQDAGSSQPASPPTPPPMTSPPPATAPPPATPPPATAPVDAGSHPPAPDGGAGGADGGTPSMQCSAQKCCNQGKGPSQNDGKDDEKKACVRDPALVCPDKPANAGK